MSADCTLITGAGGLLGGDVLRLLARRALPGDRIVALVRHRPAAACLSEEYDARLEILRGDITEPLFGLPADRYAELQTSVTGVLHAAAVTQLSISAEEAERVNVEGTRRVVEFARGAPKLERFGHVSTTCVAGKRTGTIQESELEHDAGFVNAYEWSKYEAERVVQSQDLPWTVFRLSTLIGDHSSGQVRQWNAVHRAVALLYHGLAPMVCGRPETPVDLIPDRFAAASVCHLFRHAGPCQTFHLCAGPAGTMRLDELLATTARSIEAARPAWRRRGVETPAIVDEGTFELFGRTARDVDNPIFVQVYESMRYFLPQLLYPKQFDSSAADRLLRDTVGAPPPMHSYWGLIVDTCVRTPWSCQR